MRKSQTTSSPDSSALKTRWELNRPLLYTSLAAIVLLGVVGYLLHDRASNQLASSLKSKAQQASSESDWESEIKWLRRYLKLVPDSDATVIDLAIAADNAVSLPPANRLDRVELARKSLNRAVAKALEADPPHPRAPELQRLLILRLSQYGNRFAPEILDKIISLNPPSEDTLMQRSFAIALRNTARGSSSFDKLTTTNTAIAANQWSKLLLMPTSQVLWQAWNANRNDIQLASQLLENLRESPARKSTETADDTTDGSSFDGEAALHTVVENLIARPENAEAQWVLFKHQIATTPRLATRRLADQFNARMLRLSQAYNTLDKTDTRHGGDDTGSSMPILPPPGPTTENSRPDWDYVLAVASVCNDDMTGPDREAENPLRTLDNLKKLCDYSVLDVPAVAITEIYTSYCGQLISKEDPKHVLEAYAKGIDRLGEESASLQISRISYLINAGRLKQADARLLELKKLQGKRKELFTGAEEALTHKQRLRYRSEIDSTEWYLVFFKGLIALQRDMLDIAIPSLRMASESQTQVANSSKASAAASLGLAYAQEQLWDLAAVAYEKASELSDTPNNYKIIAARAWSKGGNTERELELLSTVEQPSLELSLAILRSAIASELRRNPDSRNFRPLQNRAEEISQTLNSLDDSDGSKSAMQSELELLTLSLPDRNDGDEREAASKRILKLSERYPDNVKILTIAALTMAATGDQETTSKLLQQLEAVLGEDSFAYNATLARTLLLTGNPDAAADSLKKFAKNQPSMSVDALMLAAQILTDQAKLKAAQDLLLSISDEQQTIDSIFQLFEVSLFLQRENPGLTEEHKPQVWARRLHSLEGEEGTFWRLAEGTLAITEAQNAELAIDKRRELLSIATKLYEEIDARRPRWSYNSTLGGWIAALRGNAADAITLLRRGRNSGDMRTSTLLLLVSQLNKTNQTYAAEQELNRLGELVTANSASAAMAISIAERKGDYEQSMKLARKSAGDDPRGTDAWILLAQTAMLAARATDDRKTREILLSEAKDALDKALANSNAELLSVFRLRIQYQGLFFDTDGVRRELERTLKSNVPEPTKSLFVGRAFLQLKDPKSALEVFERIKSINPNSPDVYLGLAEYYRYKRNDAQNIQMLEKALTLGPKRTDIRSRLALGLALRQHEATPWDRIRQLVGNQDTSTGSNELLHALILINKGDETKKQQASEILANIRKRGDANVDDASRMLATLETERWFSSKNSESPEDAKAHLAKARQIYTELTRRPNPSALDLYKFGDLLLRANQITELNVVADQLDRVATGSVISLDLRLRLAKQSGNQEKADRLAEEWADRAIASGTLLKQNAWGSVGQTLTKLGFHDEALEWLAKAYESDHRFFRDYVLGLARSQRYLQATEICKTEFSGTRNPEALAMMVDITVLAGADTKFPEENEQLISAAVAQSKNIPRVIEAVATLRLSQQRYADAVELYEQANRLAPKNVRILNNLAMALSEVPGRESEAIPRIESAIAIYGRSPELLDTHGLVLLRNNESSEAVTMLREATAASNDPRYRFHLIMALLQHGDKKNAISNWALLDVRALRKLALTPGELTDLDSLQNEF